MLATDQGLLVSGLFRTIGGFIHRFVAQINFDFGFATGWDPVLSGTADGIALLGDRVYLGGRITKVGGLARTNFAAVSVVTGEALPWAPTTDRFVYALAGWSNVVFVGGDFYQINSTAITNLAALDAQTGEPLAWDPHPNFFPKTLLVKGNRLYVGGAFYEIAGQSRGSLAVFSLDQASGAPFRILADSIQKQADGQIQFNITGPANQQLRIQASRDLITWDDIGSATLTTSPMSFTDLAAPNHPHRFYRLSQ
jgi:hypothetical protein